ncbi:FKBP-type peptidyl-prolyl cis-trans isomerase [Flavobacterium sp.]|uniref:FKBP-type peptidyl-prolyl cis-trans isomerase n=1 Tax=Flavobacterium sp. TaxID=239 RepID=UPI0038FD2532
MNKVTFYFIVLITTVTLFSCQKDDPIAEITPPRAYADQYKTDFADIEEYLNSYYITVINNPGKPDDQDVTITKIPDGGTQRSIMSYKDNVFVGSTVYPQLWSRVVKLHDVDYKLYYLVLRPGIGESPCNVDGVFTSYRGDYLQRIAATTTAPVVPSYISATKFDENKFPQSFFSLLNVVRGWSEMFPLFKSGTYSVNNNDGTVSYKDFGAGVLFIPSGLGYYSSVSNSIPGYAPLVFSFKLYDVFRSDTDGDGVDNYQEDLNKDGFMWSYTNTILYPTTSDYPDDATRYADDYDRDGIPNFLDKDDDGDNYSTASEIKNPATGSAYPFADIPTCTSGKKNYLDITCHP